MIYPKNIKESKNAEYKVFQVLKNLPDEDYTVFYNQEFVSDNLSKEKLQYEIDFIIVDHRNNSFKNILILEVKGGNISYNAEREEWSQSGRLMTKSPTYQVTSSTKSFLQRYKSLLENTNVSWGLCFPDVEVTTSDNLPKNVNRLQVFDYNDLRNIDVKLDAFFDWHAQKIGKEGGEFSKFIILKNELLKGCDLFKPLSKEFEENNTIFLKLTSQQAKTIRMLKSNNNFCVQGPAGSGKTLIAYQQALEYKRQGLDVLYITFNKQIATQLRHVARKEPQINEKEGKLEITNFHFWAGRFAEQNPSYKKEKSSDEFFNTYIPNKALEMIKKPEFDVVIVDEGQDFRLNWLELLNRILKKEGKFLLFLDKNQDIFKAYQGVPNHRKVTKVDLEENCRNTKTIIKFLKEIIPNCDMVAMENSPEGSEVVIKKFKDNEEQIKFLDQEIYNLINKHKVLPGDIMIITNNVDNVSSLRGITLLGGVPLKSTYDRDFGKNKDYVFHTVINVFKGLEAEVVFLIDTQNVFADSNAFYTQASRAKNKLYVNFTK